MAPNAEIGLKVDLAPWRQGIKQAAGIVKKSLGPTVLTPFEKAAKKTLGGIRSLVGRFGKSIRAVLTSAFGPVLALLGINALLSKTKEILWGSLEAYRSYSDSVTTLRSALETLEDVDVDKTIKDVGELGNQLRLAMGITRTETNQAFSNFITRGFDTKQARQLTILAANYAKKSGKPLADVQKQVADAANGSIDAIKELGIEIAATGNRVKDAESAVLAMKDAYGDIGSDLANPSERLAAAWSELATSLGERISPIIEPIVQGFADFVTGLTQTEEGKKTLDGIADTLQWIIDAVQGLIVGVQNVVSMVTSGGKVVKNLVEKLVNDILAMVIGTINNMPGGGKLLKLFGIDPEATMDAFKSEADRNQREMQDAMNEWSMAKTAFVEGRVNGDSMLGGLRDVMRAGEQARNDATAALQREQAANRDQGFAGQAARDAEAIKAAQAASAQQTATNQKIKAAGDVKDGQRVSVQIVSRKPDRFRKMRYA